MIYHRYQAHRCLVLLYITFLHSYGRAPAVAEGILAGKLHFRCFWNAGTSFACNYLQMQVVCYQKYWPKIQFIRLGGKQSPDWDPNLILEASDTPVRRAGRRDRKKSHLDRRIYELPLAAKNSISTAAIREVSLLPRRSAGVFKAPSAPPLNPQQLTDLHSPSPNAKRPFPPPNMVEGSITVKSKHNTGVQSCSLKNDFTMWNQKLVTAGKSQGRGKLTTA